MMPTVEEVHDRSKNPAPDDLMRVHCDWSLAWSRFYKSVLTEYLFDEF
jgi:hypothetical protein